MSTEAACRAPVREAPPELQGIVNGRTRRTCVEASVAALRQELP